MKAVNTGKSSATERSHLKCRFPFLVTLALLGATPARAVSLTVFAASSLTDAFTEMGRVFDARSGNKTTFQFTGSQMLRTQLEQGARADVIASANAAQFDPLVKAGLITGGQPFAGNTLTVITPPGNRVRTLPDLAQPGVKIVIADKAVPAGDYTRRMLSSIDAAGTYGRDYSARFLKNVVSEEPNVRQVALKVSLGEADAAVVYRSDLTPSLKGKVRVVALPSRFNQFANYPIGTLKNSAAPDAARAFMQFVQSKDGQNILRKWGFQPPR